LYSRGVKLAGVSAEGSGELRCSVRVNVDAVPVSNGASSANSVRSVRVERIVASASCGVASACSDVASAYGQPPPSPKITLPRVIKNIKRAAAGVCLQRIRERLDQIQNMRCVSPVASSGVGQSRVPGPVACRSVIGVKH